MGRHATIAAALVLACSTALAHDTWFEPQPATERGEAVFALGTGNQFPTLESAVRWDAVTSAGCRDGQGRSVPLRWMADQPTRLMVRSTRPLPGSATLACMARLMPEQITLDNATVDLYFKEARPSEAVRERWKLLSERGVAWRETYTKLARIMKGGLVTADDTSQGLDVRFENTAPVLRVGHTLALQVLRDGKPLAGQMMEMRNDLSPIGIWRQSDEHGRIQFPLPLAARWLLRGVDLRAAAQDELLWESHFLTVALEVLPADK